MQELVLAVIHNLRIMMEVLASLPSSSLHNHCRPDHGINLHNHSPDHRTSLHVSRKSRRSNREEV